MTTEHFPVIGVLGGTGKEGSGLAFRWAHAGYPVFLGSRSPEKAIEAAAEMNKELGINSVRGGGNPDAAAAAQIVVLTVPFAAQKPTVLEVRAALKGKILVDVTVPLVPPKVNRVQLPENGSAVEAMQKMLGADVRVVSAFQNVSAHHLKNLDHVTECDVLVCSDDPAASDEVIKLVHATGLRGWNGGVLANSAVAEGLTSVLIALNQRYKVPSAGIRITGIPDRQGQLKPVQPAGLSLLALAGIPLIKPGDDLAGVILRGLTESQTELAPGDVIVLAQKIVSKAEGRQIALSSVTPSPRALELAAAVDKDPRLVELILRESTEIVRTRPGVLVVAHRLGLVLANAGIDHSNVSQIGDEQVLLLPLDPDGSCRRIRDSLRERSGVDVAVVIIDSIGRAWRNGTVGTAIGVSGLPGLLNMRGYPDLFERALQTTELGLADEVAAAASLIMGQAGEGRPVVLARGVPYARRDGSAAELLRPKELDMFR